MTVNGPIMQALGVAIADELAAATGYQRLAATLREKSGEQTDPQLKAEFQNMAAAVEEIAWQETIHRNRLTKIQGRLQQIQTRPQPIQPGHIGSPHATKPDYLFWGVTGPPQAEKFVERFRQAGLSRAYLEGAGPLVDIYVHKDDFQRATEAARGQLFRVVGFK